jgi:hypothetical protein
MIKNITALVGIMLMVSCSTTETITTSTISRKAIIEGNEVTLIIQQKLSLDQYNEIKKNYNLLVVRKN